jgi:hypothetical protein
MIKQTDNESLVVKANAAFEAVALDVIGKARAAKTEIVIWRDGKVVKLLPAQVERELESRDKKNRIEAAE